MNTLIKTRKNLSKIQVAAGVLLLAVAGGVIAKLLWTDHNTHDPGVTTPELLDYSIADLDMDKPYNDDHRKYDPD
jgi:homospermidine synthase